MVVLTQIIPLKQWIYTNTLVWHRKAFPHYSIRALVRVLPKIIIAPRKANEGPLPLTHQTHTQQTKQGGSDEKPNRKPYFTSLMSFVSKPRFFATWAINILRASSRTPRSACSHKQLKAAAAKRRWRWWRCRIKTSFSRMLQPRFRSRSYDCFLHHRLPQAWKTVPLS